MSGRNTTGSTRFFVRRPRPALVLLWAAALQWGLAGGQEILPLEGGQKIVSMVRTDVPPVIDGRLDDEVWSRAAVVSDLHQVNPIEYAEPSERTEVYLLYDDHALYVGVRLYDSEPHRITANVLRQGGNVTGDDAFFVTLDPFNNRRGGYFFGVNPNGVRMEGLYRNVSEFYRDWDAIYRAAAGRFDGGWTAEFEIPFKSISFDPNTDTWGLNFSRTIARRNENIAWMSRNRSWDPSASGLAVGFEGIEQGMGLDIVPSATFSGSHTHLDGLHRAKRGAHNAEVPASGFGVSSVTGPILPSRPVRLDSGITFGPMNRHPRDRYIVETLPLTVGSAHP
jgi:hypothetical protein